MKAPPSQEEYQEYIAEITRKVLRPTPDDEKDTAQQVRDKITNSDWYDYPYRVLQYSDTNMSSPAYTPSWQTLTEDRSNMDWVEATQEAVYICLFNDIMKEVEEHEP